MVKRLYDYKARDTNGVAVSGQVEAENIKTVSHSLKELGYTVVSVDAAQVKGFKAFEGVKARFFATSATDILIFLRQMSAMVNAGLPLLTALMNVIEQTRNLPLRKILINLASDIRGGKSLSEAMQRYPRLFTDFHVNMIKAGEAGGMLGEVLERLADIGYEEREIKGKVNSAFAYPLLLISLSLLIVTALLVFVLPRFISIFQESGAELPLPTTVLLFISYVLRRYWYVPALGIFAIVFFTSKGLQNQKRRYQIHNKIINLPVIGRLILIIAVSRFCKIMGALVKSGVPLLSALSVSEGLLGNQSLINSVSHVRQAVVGGMPFSESLKVSGAFPVMAVQMIAVGESTGKLDDMLFQISDFYDREATLAIRTMSTLIEPVLLLVMGVITGFIALSVLLPIFNLVKVLKH